MQSSFHTAWRRSQGQGSHSCQKQRTLGSEGRQGGCAEGAGQGPRATCSLQGHTRPASRQDGAQRQRLRLGMVGIFNNLKQGMGAFQHKITALNSTVKQSPILGCWLGRQREKRIFFFFKGGLFWDIKKKSAVGRAKAKGKLEKVAHRSGQVPGCREG